MFKRPKVKVVKTKRGFFNLRASLEIQDALSRNIVGGIARASLKSWVVAGFPLGRGSVVFSTRNLSSSSKEEALEEFRDFFQRLGAIGVGIAALSDRCKELGLGEGKTKC